MAKYFPNGIGGQTARTPASPTVNNLASSYVGQSNPSYSIGMGINTPTTIPSNVIGSGNSYSDVLNARNSLMQNATQYLTQTYPNIISGANLANFNAQYGPGAEDAQYGAGAANYVGAQTNITKQNALLAAQGYGTLLGANASTLQSVNPYQNQVAPGSTAYNPATNQPVTNGMGAAPAQIMSTASQLAQLAIQNGSASYNSDGTVNMQPYITQAQQFYGSGQIGSGSSQGGIPSPYTASGASQPGTGGQGAVPAYSGNGQSTSVAYQGQPDGQPQGYGSNGYGNVNALAPALKQYVQNVSFQNADGTATQLPFIDAERVPTAMQATAMNQAAQAGIPYLQGTGANAVLAAQQIIDVVNSAEALSIRNLKSGVVGKIEDSALNWANNWLQFNPDLSNFGQLKDAASKATTALAGGVGSGFRMNMGIIDAATQNMPTASDNLETAMTKAEALRGQIINAIAPLYPQLRGGTIFSNSNTASNPTGGATGGAVSVGGSNFTQNAQGQWVVSQ
jgi:hypothetical protein